MKTKELTLIYTLLQTLHLKGSGHDQTFDILFSHHFLILLIRIGILNASPALLCGIVWASPALKCGIVWASPALKSGILRASPALNYGILKCHRLFSKLGYSYSSTSDSFSLHAFSS